jgi:ankyrin repeat protein
VRRSDETLREDQRNLLLLRAAAEGQLPRMQHLLRLGIEIDFSDGDGFAALHHAVLSGFEDCVKELINWGLDVNAMTQHGVPLNLAAQKERVHVISILVAARAIKVRAVDFAVAHGQDVENLRSPLDFPVSRAREGALAVSSVDVQGTVEEHQLRAPMTLNMEGSKIDAKPSDNVPLIKQLSPNTDGGGATRNEASHAANQQHRRSARRERDHSRCRAVSKDFILLSMFPSWFESKGIARALSEPREQTSQNTTQITSKQDLSAFEPAH